MAKKRTKSHAQKSKVDENLAKRGLKPWLPIQPSQLPERLRKRSEQIPTGKPKKPASKRRKGGK